MKYEWLQVQTYFKVGETLKTGRDIPTMCFDEYSQNGIARAVLPNICHTLNNTIRFGSQGILPVKNSLIKKRWMFNCRKMYLKFFLIEKTLR